MVDNLRCLAKNVSCLIIWTDCDREGEYIGFEIEQICKAANTNLNVFRARYSVVNYREINYAMQNLCRLDRGLIDAVACRQELDLRTGASLTRLQSIGLQNQFPLLKNVISYGSCQFPTLGFVVEQYLKAYSFESHSFWTMKATLNSADNVLTHFEWCRSRVFDRFTGVVLFKNIGDSRNALVERVSSKPSSRWRPLPLRTVEFQRKASKCLKLSSDKLMSLAESLYNKGYISYPRTETDHFDKKFDHQALISQQISHPLWGSYAKKLAIDAGYIAPRLGKNNDNAHPPIHPTKSGLDLHGEEARVYEFITRTYLACCSNDAQTLKTEILVSIGDEYFQTHGSQ